MNWDKLNDLGDDVDAHKRALARALLRRISHLVRLMQPDARTVRARYDDDLGTWMPIRVNGFRNRIVWRNEDGKDDLSSYLAAALRLQLVNDVNDYVGLKPVRMHPILIEGADREYSIRLTDLRRAR